MTATNDAPTIPLRGQSGDVLPGLYYLQYVDAVMPTNEHVEAACSSPPRRFARPGQQDSQGRRRRTGRGVHLSSEALGLTGVLDVMEEKNGASYPVETKTAPPRTTTTAERRSGTTTPCSCAARPS